MDNVLGLRCGDIARSRGGEVAIVEETRSGVVRVLTGSRNESYVRLLHDFWTPEEIVAFMRASIGEIEWRPNPMAVLQIQPPPKDILNNEDET